MSDIGSLFWQGLLGIFVLPVMAWIPNVGRATFPLRLVFSGICLQVVLAAALLNIELIQRGILMVNRAVLALDEATRAGTSLVFGYLGGAAPPFDITEPGNNFILAFQALPLVITFSALSALLWHWRVIPFLVQGVAWMLRRVLSVDGVVGLSSAASVFVGMVEAPMMIRPHLATMSRSGLFTLMTCGMATIAGTVLALYASILEPVVPGALGQLLVASVISVPAAIIVALLMVPPDDDVNRSESDDCVHAPPAQRYVSAFSAVVEGTGDGIKLFLNIAAMLVVFVAFVHLLNQLLALLPLPGSETVTLQSILGWSLQPLMWVIGIPWSEALLAGELMATKIVVNELVGYLEMASLSSDELSAHSRLILTYAMCGFANFGSLGIMLGGLHAMCPERSRDFVQLAPLAIVSGVLATCMTAAVVGLVSALSV